MSPEQFDRALRDRYGARLIRRLVVEVWLLVGAAWALGYAMGAGWFR